MIDQRIVQMQFDNKQFESGIRTSINSLNQLDKSLRLDGAAKGLSELDRASKSFSMAPLANSVDFIASKFTTLGIIGVTALQNIANKAVDAGEKMVKAFTIDPIMTGFSEYETQINAIQTILANTQSKGKTLTDVTAALDELNTYADKTIYNFTEMTRNIGTFTAAGVDLEVATNSIQGIANLAAISGSTSQQASTAMYQLSQAMASGTVKLMDWNSVVNAGMGGQVFQDALKETARVHGIAIDQMIEEQGSFRETLQEGWLTTDILTETLEKFTATTEGLTEEQIKANREMWKARGYTDAQIDAIFEMGRTATDAATKVKTFTQLFDTLKEAAQSGWTQSWEILIGDFEEAKALLTEISDIFGEIIGASATERNNVLTGWKDAGGRDDLIQGFRNILDSILAIADAAERAYKTLFPGERFLGMDVDGLVGITEKFVEFTEKLKLSDATANRLERTFAGVFAIFDIGAQALSAVGSAIGNLLNAASPLANGFLDATAALGDFLVGLSNTIRESNLFEVAIENALGTLSNLLAKSIELFGKFAAAGKNAFEWLKNTEVAQLVADLDPLSAVAEAASWAIEKFGNALDAVKPRISDFCKVASEGFKKFTEALNTFVNGSGMEMLGKFVNSGVMAAFGVEIYKLIDAFKGFMDNAGGIVENISGIFEGLGDALEGLQNKLNADAVKNIAIGVGILAASLALLASIDKTEITASISAITVMFAELIGALAIMNKFLTGGSILGMMSLVSAIKGIATAMLLLAAAVKLLGSMNLEEVAVGLVGLGGAMAILVAGLSYISNNVGQIYSGAAGVIALALAIGIMASAIKTIGSMDLAGVAKGVLGLGAAMVALSLFLKTTDLSTMGISAGLGLMAFAIGLTFMSTAIRNLGSMDIVSMAKGLVGLAAGLLIVGNAVTMMPTNLAAIGAGLLIVAAALTVMSVALHIMGAISLENLCIALAALAGSLALLVPAMNAMTGTLAGAAAMLVAAAAILALGVALNVLAMLSWQNAIQAILTLAAALGVMAAAAVFITPLAPALLALGAAMIVFSLGVAAAGAALLVLSAGLTSAGVALAAFMASVVAVISGVASAITAVITGIGDIIISLATVISNAAPAVADAVVAFIQMIVTIVSEGITAIVDAFDQFNVGAEGMTSSLLALGATAAVLVALTAALAALAVGMTAFGAGCAVVAGGVTLLAGAFDLLALAGSKVASSLTDIYDTVAKMAETSFLAVAANSASFRKAGEQAAEMLLEGFNNGLTSDQTIVTVFITNMITQITEAIPQFTVVGTTLATSFVTSVVTALNAGAPTITTTVVTIFTTVMSAGLETINGQYGNFLNAGTYIGNAVAQGIYNTMNTTVSAAMAVVSAANNAVRSYYSSFYSSGGYLVQGLAAGISANAHLAINAASSVAAQAHAALNSTWGVASPAKAFIESSKFAVMGLAKGLLKYSNLAVEAAEYVADRSIRPVMTMTDDVQALLSNMTSGLKHTTGLANGLAATIVSEEKVNVKHSFGVLTVKGVNDKDEFIESADYAVEEMLTQMMRRQSRL